MFGRREIRIETERMALRPPAMGDWRPWAALRRDSEGFLKPWEPTWAPDHLSRRAFAAAWPGRAGRSRRARRCRCS
jgi:ribosomal-protein-alanine N-acetyltransferase